MYSKIPLKNIEKIQLITTNCKKTIAQIKKETGCDFIMNCTLYNYNTLKPCCVYKENGRLITLSKDGYWCYAWNNGADIQMVHSTQISGFKNAFACSAMLKEELLLVYLLLENWYCFVLKMEQEMLKLQKSLLKP